MDSNYNARFEDNILVVGRTGCGKTTFVQNLGENKMFGNIKEVIWASKYCFQKKGLFCKWKVDFTYVETIDEFDDLLEHVQKRKPYCNENNLGENIELDYLIVLDDVSGLADRSDIFANFLTVSRKFGLTCVYVFHTLYPTRQNW